MTWRLVWVGKLSVLNMLMTEQLLFLCLRTMTQQLNLLIVFRMVWYKFNEM